MQTLLSKGPDIGVCTAAGTVMRARISTIKEHYNGQSLKNAYYSPTWTSTANLVQKHKVGTSNGILRVRGARWASQIEAAQGPAGTGPVAGQVAFRLQSAIQVWKKFFAPLTGVLQSFADTCLMRPPSESKYQACGKNWLCVGGH